MTDKERLKMVKHDLEERGQYGGFLDDCDTEWLIEQAEKVETATKIFNDIETLQTWDEWKGKDLNNRIANFLNK